MNKKNNKVFILGVTGVIGSGKSTLCRLLEKNFGFHFIEADKIVHELYQNGKPGYFKIKKFFGSQFVGKKEVNRGKLRRLVVKSPQKLWILNKMIHPLVAHEVNKKIVQLKGLDGGKKGTLVCIEAVYFEPQDLGKFIDQLIILDASEKTIAKRLKSRKIPSGQLHILYKFQKLNISKKGILLKNEDSIENLLKNFNSVAAGDSWL